VTASHELERQSAAWVEAGIITAEQRDRILAAESRPGEAGSRLVPIFGLLGAALVVLGVILVVSQNWDEISRQVKLAGGLVLLAATYAVGYWVRFGPLRLARTGEALLLAGTGVLLADLALISQQYNIDFNPSPLLLPVLLVAIAFSYLLRSRAYITASSAVGVIWLIAESQQEGSVLEARDSMALLAVVGGGVWLLIAAELHRRLRWPEFAAPLQVAGALALFAAVYVLGFYRHYDAGDDEMTVSAGIALLVVPLVVIAGAVIVIAARREDAGGWRPIEASLRLPVLVTAATLGLLLLLALASAIEPRESAEDEFILYTAGFWVVALLMTLDLGWLGLALRREWWINAALLYVGLFALSRYFDLFSDYSRTGLLFAGAGVLLLGLAFALERGRRALHRELREEPAR
jgi:uncharacterized membrane protein